MMRYLLILIIAVLVYCQGIKPIVADRYYYLHKTGDQTALTKALEWAPDDTQLMVASGNIMRAINTSNGDQTLYGLWFMVGLRLFQQGNRDSGLVAVKKALYYYPDFAPAKAVMRQLHGKTQG